MALKGFLPILAAAMAFVSITATAQHDERAAALLCRSNDGIVVITQNTISVRDYAFEFDTHVKAGVIRMRDAHSGATAVVDVRDEDGLYVTITEGSLTMQLAIPRTNITLRSSDTAAHDVASGISAADLISFVQGAPIAASR
ncbi:MAG: hypothetical protein HY962_02860 [Ignavibacteriae bacterium]|nr:hypothetical protein [Ignavibacteriota bacterium]